MAAKTKKTTAADIADALAIVRVRMAKDKLLNDKLTKQFKAALDAEQLSAAGDYQLSHSVSFKVSNEEKALEFAQNRGLIKIDTAAVHKTFQLDAELRFVQPEEYGFEAVDSVRVMPRGISEEE